MGSIVYESRLRRIADDYTVNTLYIVTKYEPSKHCFCFTL